MSTRIQQNIGGFNIDDIVNAKNKEMEEIKKGAEMPLEQKPDSAQQQVPTIGQQHQGTTMRGLGYQLYKFTNVPYIPAPGGIISELFVDLSDFFEIKKTVRDHETFLKEKGSKNGKEYFIPTAELLYQLLVIANREKSDVYAKEFLNFIKVLIEFDPLLTATGIRHDDIPEGSAIHITPQPYINPGTFIKEIPHFLLEGLLFFEQSQIPIAKLREVGSPVTTRNSNGDPVDNLLEKIFGDDATSIITTIQETCGTISRRYIHDLYNRGTWGVSQRILYHQPVKIRTVPVYKRVANANRQSLTTIVTIENPHIPILTKGYTLINLTRNPETTKGRILQAYIEGGTQ